MTTSRTAKKAAAAHKAPASSSASPKKTSGDEGKATHRFAMPMDLTDPSSGHSKHFEPGDEVPEWASKLMRAGSGADLPKQAEPSDAPVPGPGQSFVYDEVEFKTGG